MKKLFALLFLASAVLSSCSSDSDNFAGGDNNIKAEKYPVNFSVKSQAFEVDKSQLKRESIEGPSGNYIFQVVVYDKLGKPCLDSIFSHEDVSKLLSKEESIPFSLELPEGEYFVSLMYTMILETERWNLDFLKFKPKDYFTDTYGGGNLGLIMGGGGANRYNYYQTLKISVPNTTSDAIPVELEPMWSNITITIEDPATFKVPTGTVWVRILPEPAFTMYSLKTKLAISELTNDPWNKQITPLEDIRKMEKLSFAYAISKTTKENNNKLRLKVQFFSIERPNKGDIDSIISEHIIELDEEVENGLNYKISGKLGNIANVNDSQAFSITLGEFSNKEINF